MPVTITLTTPDGSPLAEDEVPAKGTILLVLIEAMDESWPADGTGRLLGWVPSSKAGPAARILLAQACRVANSPVPA